jgi:hypothetical protein
VSSRFRKARTVDFAISQARRVVQVLLRDVADVLDDDGLDAAIASGNAELESGDGLRTHRVARDRPLQEAARRRDRDEDRLLVRSDADARDHDDVRRPLDHVRLLARRRFLRHVGFAVGRLREPDERALGELHPDALLPHPVVVDPRVVELALELVEDGREEVAETARLVLLLVELLLALEQRVRPPHLDPRALDIALGDVGGREARVDEDALVAFALVGLRALADREGDESLAQALRRDQRAPLDLLHEVGGAAEVLDRPVPVAGRQRDHPGFRPGQERRSRRLGVLVGLLSLRQLSSLEVAERLMGAVGVGSAGEGEEAGSHASQLLEALDEHSGDRSCGHARRAGGTVQVRCQLPARAAPPAGLR